MIKNLFAAVLVLLMISSMNAFAQKRVKEYKGPLLGKWATPNLGLDASHLAIEFESGHKFSYDLESRWNGKYSLDGTKLFSSYYIPFLSKWVSDTSIVLITADTLVLVTGKDTAQTISKFIRESDSSNASGGLVGSWYSNNFQGDKTVITYDKNGDLSIRKTLNKYNGYFVVQNNIFSVFSKRALIVKMKYQIIRGDLYLYKIGSPGVMKLVRGS